jgi:hypothetical protein
VTTGSRTTPGRGRLRTAHPLDIQGWVLELATADIYLELVGRIEALDAATHNRSRHRLVDLAICRYATRIRFDELMMNDCQWRGYGQY